MIASTRSDQERLEEQRTLARADLLYFTAEILGYGRPLDLGRPYLFLDTSARSPHRRLAEFIQAADRDGITESLDLEPRGFLKSTIGTIGYALWCLARDPEEAILIVAATADKAEMFLSQIKVHCEGNERLIGLFPALAPHHRGPWQADRVTIEGRTRPKGPPSIRVMGLDQGKAGAHYDRIVCDDLHDESNCATADQCQKVIYAYQRFRPLLVDQRKGEIRVTGTRWHGSDLYGHMLERNEIAKSKGRPAPVMVRVTKLRRDDGTPEWPGMYDEEEIRRLKETLDPEIYFSQYENDPFTESQQIFKRSDIDRAIVEHDAFNPEGAAFFSACDPAYATNRWNDYSAIVTWAVHRAPGARFGYLVTVVDVYQERVEVSSLVDEIYRVNKTWKPICLVIEAHAQGIVMNHVMRESAKERGAIPWRPIDRGGGGASSVRGKQRIRKLEPYLRNGTLRLLRSARGIGSLIRELQDYPRGAHDDTIDALADFPEITFAPSASSPPRRGLDLSKATTWEEYRSAMDDEESDARPGFIVNPVIS